MSNRLKNIDPKYYIAIGIGIALIFLSINFIPWFASMSVRTTNIRLATTLVASIILIIVLVIIFRKPFTINVYKIIIALLIGAIIATFISLIFDDFFIRILKIIVIVICIVVLRYNLKLKYREEARIHGELSPQQKIAQRELNIQIAKFAIGGVLMAIGIIIALFSLAGIGGLGVDIEHLTSGSGYILLAILVGIPFVVFIVPGYFLVRSAYRKYDFSKQKN